MSSVRFEIKRPNVRESKTTTLKSILIDCQKLPFRNDNLIEEMEHLYEKMQHSAFVEELKKLLLHVFIHVGSENYVNSIFKLLTSFCSKLNDDFIKEEDEDDDDDESQNTSHPFIEDLYYFLLQVQNARHYMVRQRALRLIGATFKQMSVLSVDQNLWQKFYSVAAVRLRDSSANVRAEAVMTFCFLQDPFAAQCPIIKDFLFLLSNDPCYSVRCNIAAHLAVTPETLAPLQNRLFDVNSSVRKTALFRISQRVSVQCFTVAQRMEILNCINDLSNDVRTVLKENIVRKWLQTCNNDVIAFLNLLDVQVSQEKSVIEQVLNFIFENYDVNELAKSLNIDPTLHLIPIENLTETESVFWLCLCRFVKTLERDDAPELFDAITPTIVELCDYLEEYLKTLSSNDDDGLSTVRSFIFKNLLSLAAELDFSDLFGQKKLNTFVLNTLKSESCLVDMIKPLILCIRTMTADPDSFLNEIMEIINEISKPLLIDSNVNEPENLVIIHKVLLILIETLKTLVKQAHVIELNCMKDNLVLPMIRHNDTFIAEAAIEALGLFCMFSLEEAKANFARFMEAIIFGNINVQIMSLKIAFNLLMLYGSKLISEDEDDDNNDNEPDINVDTSEKAKLTSFLEKLALQLLNSKVRSIVHTVVEGVARVMIYQKISAPSLFSKLCIMRHAPSNMCDAKLKYCIAAFISEYAESKCLTADCLIQTFVNVLDTVFDAKKLPLSKVDGSTVAIAILQLAVLISPETDGDEGSDIHDELALKLCQNILDSPNSKSVPAKINLFNHLKFCTSVSEDLYRALKKLQKKLKNKRLLKIVGKYFKKIEETKMQQGDEVFLRPMQLSFSQKSPQNDSDNNPISDEDDSDGEISENNIPSKDISLNDDEICQSLQSSQSSSASCAVNKKLEIQESISESPEESDEQIVVPESPEQVVIPESPENLTHKLLELTIVEEEYETEGKKEKCEAEEKKECEAEEKNEHGRNINIVDENNKEEHKVEDFHKSESA